MHKGSRLIAALAFSASSLGLAACGGHDKTTENTSNGTVMTPAATPAPTASAPVADTAPREGHHSKLGGALAGAAVGHVLGGHAMAGAAAGALIQHERNKHR